MVFRHVADSPTFQSTIDFDNPGERSRPVRSLRRPDVLKREKDVIEDAPSRVVPGQQGGEFGFRRKVTRCVLPPL
jgi:hypothetical protein